VVHPDTVAMVEMANVANQVLEEVLVTLVHKVQLVLQVFAILLNVIQSSQLIPKVQVKKDQRKTLTKNQLVSLLNKIPE
jgi:hypothetical protein